MKRHASFHKKRRKLLRKKALRSKTEDAIGEGPQDTRSPIVNGQFAKLIYETKPSRPAKKWGERSASSYGKPSVLIFVGPNGPIEINGKPAMMEVPYYRGSGIGKKNGYNVSK